MFVSQINEISRTIKGHPVSNGAYRKQGNGTPLVHCDQHKQSAGLTVVPAFERFCVSSIFNYIVRVQKCLKPAFRSIRLPEKALARLISNACQFKCVRCFGEVCMFIQFHPSSMHFWGTVPGHFAIALQRNAKLKHPSQA